MSITNRSGPQRPTPSLTTTGTHGLLTQTKAPERASRGSSAADGIAVHRFIALLAQQHRSGPPSKQDIVDAGCAFVGTRRSTSAMLARRSVCITMASVYVERHWPARGHLHAAQTAIGDAECDLVWAMPGGLVIHELKTGMFALDPLEPAREQARRQLAAARNELGSRVLAVHVLALRHPERCFVVESESEPDSHPVALPEVGR